MTNAKLTKLPAPGPRKPLRLLKESRPAGNPDTASPKTNGLQMRLPAAEWAYVKALGARDNRSAIYYVQLALIEFVRKHRLNPSSQP